MWAFLVRHLCDKRFPDALSGLSDTIVVIDVNFFLLERADEPFDIPVLPRVSTLGNGNLNAMSLERCDISL